MKHGAFRALVAGFGVTWALHAGAQDFDELGPPSRREHVESPQDVAVELRFGRYLPNADDGLDSTPYADMFGNGNRYYGGVELDWQVLRIPYLGTFGPGVSVGYTRSSARAPFEPRPGEAPDTQRGLSDQSTSLTIYPMYVVGVLRADVIARETAVPLVPYGKLGLGVALWNINLGDEPTRVDGDRGRGLSYGPQFALGGMFLLDVLDLDDARTADAELGLNHSYVFAEWYVSDLSGFGSKDRLNVGTNTWMAGLALEF